MDLSYQSIEVLPPAYSLIQSMRDVGYCFSVAIADIIDNSITAQASQIDLFIQLDDDTGYINIIDNGYGMTADELINAMQYGSKNPLEKRHQDDLGRFGLGLKTASFSQCKSLLVLSKKNNSTAIAQWDLDEIAQTNKWQLRIPNNSIIENLPHIHKLKNNGTYILWQKLDRFLEGGSSYDKIREMENHISLVFHRYLSGEYGNKIKISINDNKPISSIDPFYKGYAATQKMPPHDVLINNHKIKISPYILPYHDKIASAYRDEASSFYDKQGCYIYRNGRLIDYGKWFGVTNKSELNKLARIQIDFTNELDELWKLDIQKSKVQMPNIIKQELKQIIEKITGESKRVYTKRSEKLLQSETFPVWHREKGRNFISYSIDKNHPLIENFLDKNSVTKHAFNKILNLVEKSLPVQTIYSDYADTPNLFITQSSEENINRIKQEVTELYHDIRDKHSFERFIEIISNIPEYKNNITFIKNIITEEMQNHV